MTHSTTQHTIISTGNQAYALTKLDHYIKSPNNNKRNNIHRRVATGLTEYIAILF